MKIDLFTFRIYILSFIVLIINDILILGYDNVNPSDYIFYLYPLIGSLILMATYYLPANKLLIAYLLFFTTSLSMVFKLTQPMTGNLVESKYYVLFGLSFYSLTLSYITAKNRLVLNDLFIAANPLLIITGPVALYFKQINHVNIRRRINFYFPFLIIGIFFFQIVASPLTSFFPLIENTNSPIAIAYGIIFELYIYFNFAGLSLMLYAIFGIIGVAIPLNFKQPFSSRNLIEFWRGWHISLSSVLKELFYIPTRKKTNSSVAILVVFICSGLWHGVTTNFIIWGMFHGICFALTKTLLKKNYSILSTIILLMAIPLGRIIFSDSNIYRLAQKFSFQDLSFDGSIIKSFGISSYLALFIGLLIVTSEFLLKNRFYFKQRSYKFLRIPPIQFVLILLIVLLIYNTNGINYAAYGQR